MDVDSCEERAGGGDLVANRPGGSRLRDLATFGGRVDAGLGGPFVGLGFAVRSRLQRGLSMKASDWTAEQAVIECLAIVEDCAQATGTGRFADGYRAAAADVRARLEAKLGRREPDSWERDLRDVEIEARTLSRVIGLIRREEMRSSSAIARRALRDLIEAINDGEAESAMQLARDAG